MDTRVVAEALAAAFLDGPWTSSAMARRGALALGRSPRWLRGLCRRIATAFPDGPPRDRFEELADQLARDAALLRACAREPRFALRFVAPKLAMRDVHREWGLPQLATTGDVATWLGLTPADLLWFADCKGLARHGRGGALDHYVRRWLPKRLGGARLVEAPKRWLKELQRRVLHELIDRIPPHEAAHGFRQGRSVVSHARSHASRPIVLRMDLEDFFVSIPAARVVAVFRGAGYPHEVSRVLAGLCTTRSPADEPIALSEHPTRHEVAALRRARGRYRARHLPQGAPTSPALSNLCAYGLDVRLSAAARTIDATYTRYADDLVFSGDRRLVRFAPLVGGIAIEQGFSVQHRKTRLMRAAVRQEVTGLVVNAEAPSIPRRDYERLKATLHNCVRFGPELQNRDRHPDFRACLEGKVAWVRHVDPDRGARLERVLEAIDWTAS